MLWFAEVVARVGIVVLMFLVTFCSRDTVADDNDDNAAFDDLSVDLVAAMTTRGGSLEFADRKAALVTF